uniref:Uncharacterized protein n=1 Tax=Glossina pallidipes TaxID=7398 RepID=A0A1B0A7B6_GLOPL
MGYEGITFTKVNQGSSTTGHGKPKSNREDFAIRKLALDDCRELGVARFTDFNKFLAKKINENCFRKDIGASQTHTNSFIVYGNNSYASHFAQLSKRVRPRQSATAINNNNVIIISELSSLAVVPNIEKRRIYRFII